MTGSRWLWPDVAVEPDRAQTSLVERLRRASVPALGEAMHGFGLVRREIRWLAGSLPMCGPAVTVEVLPGDNLGLHRALLACRPGDVLTVAASADETAGLVGELVTLEARRIDIAGIVVDGSVRDIAQLRSQSVTVFALGMATRRADKSSRGRIGWPVAVGGAVIQPGDYVVGDQDGLAVLPQSFAWQVVNRALEIMAHEQEIQKRMAAGEKLGEALQLFGRERGAEA